MATVKVKFRASSVGTGEGTLVYKVTHRRVTRQITTGYRLYPQEWDGAHSKVVIPSDRDSRRQAYLKALKEKIADDMTLFREIIALLDCTGGHYTADEVVGQYRIPPETGGFMCFARSLTTELKRTGRERTAERYTTVLNSFRRFLAERGDIPLNRIESALMVEYESHLKAEGICPNSSSFYMRGLRAVYNRAVEKGLTVQRNPFRHVYTGIDKTVKRAIPLKAVRQIRDQDLRLEPTMDWARDLFHVLVLHTRHVVHRHGIPEEIRPEERSPVIPQTEDRTAAVHQMGETHAGNCQQVRHLRDTLPAACHQGYADRRKKAVQVCRPQGEPSPEKTGDAARTGNPPHHVCRPPRMGQHCQKQEHPGFHYQRGDGA